MRRKLVCDGGVKNEGHEGSNEDCLPYLFPQNQLIFRAHIDESVDNDHSVSIDRFYHRTMINDTERI